MKLGEVSQIVVGVKDLDESVSHYRKLGFRVLASDKSPYPWAQVTDDTLLLLLNQDGKQYIGLLYFSGNFDEVIRHLREGGVTFLQEIKQGDELNQVIFSSPDGFMLSVTNRDATGMFQPSGPHYLTMTKAQQLDTANYPNSKIGFFGEFCHRVENFAEAKKFWEMIGFERVHASGGPYSWGLMRDGWQVIGLHETNDFDYAAITYFAKDTREKIRSLRNEGIAEITQFTGTGGNADSVVITSPEGQKVFLFNF